MMLTDSDRTFLWKAGIFCGLCKQKQSAAQDWETGWVLWQRSKLTDGATGLAVWIIIESVLIFWEIWKLLDSCVYWHSCVTASFPWLLLSAQHFRSSSALNLAHNHWLYMEHNMPTSGLDHRSAGSQSCLCSFSSLIADCCRGSCS